MLKNLKSTYLRHDSDETYSTIFVQLRRFMFAKGRNPHTRTSWKLVGNPGCEIVAN